VRPKWSPFWRDVRAAAAARRTPKKFTTFFKEFQSAPEKLREYNGWGGSGPMDASSVVTAHALSVQAGAIVALALALAAALAGRAAKNEARAAAVAAENESLLDEVRRLRQAASVSDHAEAANEAKWRLLATMSHEIRTPISGIVGMTDLLRQAGLPPEQASYVEAIRGSGEALIALIDELLDFSRIEAGRFGLTVDEVDIVRLVEGVVELLAPAAQGKGLEIAASISANAPPVLMTDGMRLRQVLMNLAGNAVKFTSIGGVCVAVELDGAKVRFKVSDSGPGVPLGRRLAIFEDFEQGGDSSPHRCGAGLGLAISRKLVALMGGSLTVQDNPGGGSIFAFSIPAPAADRPHDAPPSPPISLNGKRALIVANSLFEGPAIAERLAEAGATIVRAEGFEAGLAALREPGGPDLVIVDCALGAEATRTLAKEARAAGAGKSLVLFSPFERRALGRTSLDGFDGWLVKPVRARSLFARLVAEFPTAEGAPEARDGLVKPRALIAEDNDINAIVSENALRRLGFEVVRAADGAEALRLASPKPGEPPPFDLVLMDMRMPGLDGLEAARRMRALEVEAGAPPTPVIALTAGGLEERGTAQAAAFDGFLGKPFELEDLKRAIDAVRERRRQPSQILSRAS